MCLKEAQNGQIVHVCICSGLLFFCLFVCDVPFCHVACNPTARSAWALHFPAVLSVLLLARFAFCVVLALDLGYYLVLKYLEARQITGGVGFCPPMGQRFLNRWRVWATLTLFASPCRLPSGP